MLRKAIIHIVVYILAVVIGGLAAALLSTPFIMDMKISIIKYAYSLGVITIIYSIFIIPVMLVFHILVCQFLPQLYLLKLYPVFAYAIFGANHFLAGFTFFSKNYWPTKFANITMEHLIVLAIAAALSGSTAIYVNIGAEKMNRYYQKSNG